VKLATFTPPNRSDPLAGEVVGDRVRAFQDGIQVIDVLSGQTPQKTQAEWPLS
jgi:hypothetical protein